MTQPALVVRVQETVEAALQATVQVRQDPLYRMMEYQMGWVDEGGSPVSPSLMTRSVRSVRLMSRSTSRYPMPRSAIWMPA